MANVLNQSSGPNHTVWNGDCVEISESLPDESVGYSIFSPPFGHQLYSYSDSPRDMSNSATEEQFETHFRFLVRQLTRITKPGRLCSLHVMNLPVLKSRAGYIGIDDFRGDVIRLFQSEGWIFHSEVVIWKDAVTQMQRTKSLGLLHKQILKDSCMSRMAIPDTVVTFSKPGENPEPVDGPFTEWHGDESFTSSANYSIDVWQRYASPVWMDINPSKTLQYTTARDENDERHICPLQLQVIERCIDLWSNPGDVVFSPFGGIGSEPYSAILMGRKGVAIELKASYFKVLAENCRIAESKLATKSRSLFDAEELATV